MKLTLVGSDWLEVFRKITENSLLSFLTFVSSSRQVGIFTATPLITHVTLNYNFATQTLQLEPVGSNRTYGHREILYYFNIGASFYIETLLLFCCCFFSKSILQIYFNISVFLRLLYCFLLLRPANSFSLVGFTMTLFERNVRLHSVFI